MKVWNTYDDYGQGHISSFWPWLNRLWETCPGSTRMIELQECLKITRKERAIRIIHFGSFCQLRNVPLCLLLMNTLAGQSEGKTTNHESIIILSPNINKFIFQLIISPYTNSWFGRWTGKGECNNFIRINVNGNDSNKTYYEEKEWIQATIKQVHSQQSLKLGEVTNTWDTLCD